MKITQKKEFLINVVFYITVAVILFLVFRFLTVYLFPFIIGIAVTVLVQKPARWLSAKVKLKKGYCALLMVILSYSAIAAALFLGAVKLLEFSATTLDNYSYVIDDFLDNISIKLNEFKNYLPPAAVSAVENGFDNILDSFTSYISSVAKNAAKTTPIFITSCVVTVVASCYIARDYDRFKDSINSVLAERFKVAGRKIKEIFKNNVLRLIKGYIIILIMTIAELAVGLMALGVKGFLLFAVAIGFLDLLPVLGTGTVLIPWGIYALASSDVFLGIGLLILYAVIMIVRNIIEPKIIGKQIGLHPLITLIAVFVGFRLFGLIGVIILPFGVMLVWKMYEEGIFELVLNK